MRIRVPARWNGNRSHQRKTTSCIDYDRELPAGRIAALGLNPVAEYYACKTGEHVGHKKCEKRNRP